MATEREVDKAVAEVRRILDGIDRDESFDDGGWWETSRGVAFGAGKLTELEAFIRTLMEGARS